MQEKSTNIFWNKPAEQWLKDLNSSKSGLTQEQAKQILAASPKQKHARSSLKKDFDLFIGQFKSPLMLMLIGAVILAGFLGDTSDVYIILFIVFSTGILSFLQERNAGKVVEKLQSLIALKGTVLRAGKEEQVYFSSIVPGDILVLKAGDMIPADCLILSSEELHNNESSLTGESYPVRKKAGIVDEKTELSKRTNCLWEGTTIVSGNSKAIVINTGDQTIFGNITRTSTLPVETTFEKGIKEFGYFLMKITLVLSFFILIVNLLNHKSVIESALFALALAVGMAPELLPAITTIAMSAGAKRLLQKKVVVKKLASIQNLGEINLLCTDKTGTITEGAIKVSGFKDGAGENDDYIKQLAYWNAYFETGYTNPIDDALRNLHLPQTETVTKTGEVPYDFIRKKLSISIKVKDKNILVTKGAFKEIISSCISVKKGTDIVPVGNVLQELNDRFEAYGKSGIRAIGVATKYLQNENLTKEDETEMIFAGFILLEDPVKPGITDTIDQLKKLHVNLKIITGDNRNVARSIALQLGVNEPVIMTGDQMLTTSPEALIKLAKDVHIFAEVEPHQKERIIQSLRKNFTVAYMGDGINDVPAINAADVGMSVENAVDVAKEAADFVLMEKNISVIVDGVKEGRTTFANTLKYIFINTGSTFGNMFSVAVASLLLPFLPMLPKQILLTNFITDFPYLAVASDNVDKEQLTHPGKWKINFIRRYMVIFGIHSSVFDVITFLTLFYLLKVKESAFQTGWFIESILTELFILFIIRTFHNFFKSRPGKYLTILSAAGLAITILLPYTGIGKKVGLFPLPAISLAILFFIVLLYIITADLLKIWFFKKYNNR